MSVQTLEMEDAQLNPRGSAGNGTQRSIVTLLMVMTMTAAMSGICRAQSATAVSERGGIWKAAVFSCAVAWRRGPRAGSRQCRPVCLNRIFHLGSMSQSSTRLDSNSSAW